MVDELMLGLKIARTSARVGLELASEGLVTGLGLEEASRTTTWNIA